MALNADEMILSILSKTCIMCYDAGPLNPPQKVCCQFKSGRILLFGSRSIKQFVRIYLESLGLVVLTGTYLFCIQKFWVRIPASPQNGQITKW